MTGFVIAGLGVTAQGRDLGIPARGLRREALELALADAGLRRADVDGYIGTSADMFDDVRHLGLAPGFAWNMQAGGATAIWSVINAMGAIAVGQASVVACVYGATPSLGARRGAHNGYGGFSYGYPSMYGLIGAAATHALHARRRRCTGCPPRGPGWCTPTP
jgi:acetyl-CoA acetyltransferase